MGRRQDSRRWLALVACFLWLLGTEALPALHQAAHDSHHTHDANGVIEIDHGNHHHTVATKTVKRQRSQRLAIDHPIDSGHQAGGVAHHAIAMLQALPPALPPVAQLEKRVASAPLAIPLVSIGTQPSARGPPSHA